VLDPVWRLYARAIELVGSTATLLEWDAHIPSFDEVHNEALKADRFLRRRLEERNSRTKEVKHGQREIVIA
jgi:uncharacterized protein (UPF0276 family)